jgi:phosphoribosylamine--glycine ligase/phosphoribosylformylglycinamidine cyclo-ligase
VFHAGTKKTSEGKIVTDGGRVLAVCAAGNTLKEAVDLAYRGVDVIEFEGKTVRRDIAHRSVSFSERITEERSEMLNDDDPYRSFQT